MIPARNPPPAPACSAVSECTWVLQSSGLQHLQLWRRWAHRRFATSPLIVAAMP